MAVDIELKGEDWTGINKIRVPLDGGGTQDFAIGGGSPTLQTKTKTYTPTESQQTESVSADTGYDGLDEVNITVGAISSTYIGSGITQRTSSDLAANGDTVTAPAGYYASQATKAVASGTEGTPTATKSAVSNHALTVTPSVTNSAGYIEGGTKTGTAVTVRAIELVSGNKVITQNDTGIDVATYSSVTVNVTGGGGVGTLLATKSLGTISTSSTSATDTGQSLSVSGISLYDALLVETSVDTVTNNRHTCTAAFIFMAATSTRNTKSGATIATLKQNYKISSSGVTTVRTGTTAYGIYPNSITISNGTATIPMYTRYNSTSTGTINGTYTARVYGLNLYDLIGG